VAPRPDLVAEVKTDVEKSPVVGRLTLLPTPDEVNDQDLRPT